MLSFMKLNENEPEIIRLKDMEKYLPDLISLDTIESQAEAFNASSRGG